jgi:hypothetical protein
MGASVSTDHAVSLTAREVSEVLLLDVAGPQRAARNLQSSVAMTINTTEDPRPVAESDVVIEQPIANEILPNTVGGSPSEPDLESRIKQRRAELVASFRELKVDRRLGASESRDKLKATISELAHIVKWGVVDGWASIGEPVTHKLEQWLATSARQLAAKNEP